MVYAKGKSVFELIDPDGHIYVLQAHDAQFPIESLAKLGEQMKLSAWVRVEFYKVASSRLSRLRRTLSSGEFCNG